jgi:iron complex transport system substrate-binding protein
MRLLTSLSFIGCLALGIAGCGADASPTDAREPAADYQRIVSLSGAVTETLFALGQGERIVGIDVTSTYPPEGVADIAQLGHVRNLNVEGVLGLQPDLIIYEEADAELPALRRLAAAGIPTLTAPSEYSLETPRQRLDLIADRLGLDGEATALRSQLAADAQRLEVQRQRLSPRPRVLFIYARGTGHLMVAGRDTPAEAVIGLAGGVNAADAFEGFRALSAEGLMEARPDVLLLFESGLRSLGGLEGLLDVPGVDQTPAGRHERVIAMDGLYLLGFTPRAAAAALELSQRLQAVTAGEEALTERRDER